jgi:hypothetical protein
MEYQVMTRKIWNWLCRISKWLNELRYIYLLILVPILVYTPITYFIDDLSLTRLYSGVILQVAGISLAIKGLFDIRGYFKKDGLFVLGKQWIERFPKFKQVKHDITGSSNIKITPASIMAYGTVSSEGRTIEQRLDDLETKTHSLAVKHQQLEHEIEDNKKQQHDAIDAEKNEREKEESNIKELIEGSSINGLWLEIIGLSWIAIGILISTSSPTIVLNNFPQEEEIISSSLYELTAIWNGLLLLLNDINLNVSLAVIALCALGISIWQSINIHKHNKLSVRPALCSWTSNQTNHYNFKLVNNGIGPAIIKGFHVYLDDKEIEGHLLMGMQKVLTVLFKEYPFTSSQSVLNKDYVIPEKEAYEIIDIKFTTLKSPHPQEVEKIMKRARLKVSYESAYKEKFIFDTSDDETNKS